MNFGDALQGLKEGKNICRQSWNSDKYITFPLKDAYSQDWIPEAADILAEDWRFFQEETEEERIERQKLELFRANGILIDSTLTQPL